jgi:hypothetical protein
MIRPMCKLTKILTCGLLVLVLAACAGPTPIPVFVTPTPSGPTVVPTVVPAGATQTTEPEVTPVPPSATPQPSAEGTGFGPIVPPDYTPPPTETPRPTDTPEIGTATVTPTPTISPTPPPGLNPAQVGIQIHPRLTQDEWRDMLYWADNLGVGWIKVQFPWDEMEPDGANVQAVHWRELELYVQEAASRGFNVMVSIAKAPDWARPTNQENGPPSDPQLLADFIDHILSRFGGAIHAIEVWNEPNLLREWNGVPMNGAEYMKYFDVAYQTITAWSQTSSHPIKVLTAGLAPTGNSDFSVDDRIFLQQMYEAGLANYPDIALGAHPYSWGNAPDTRCCDPVPDRSWDDDPHFFFLENIEALRQIALQYGHDVEIWGTEFGWATYDGLGAEAPQGFFNYVTEDLQAQYTINALDILQNSGEYSYVGTMILWNLNFAVIPGAVAERQEEQAGYSLLRPDMLRRPVFYAVRAALNPEYQ